MKLRNIIVSDKLVTILFR